MMVSLSIVFRLFRFNSWVASVLIHSGVGAALLFITVGGSPDSESEDPVLIEGPPIMSLPVPYSEPVEEQEEQLSPEPEPEPECLSEEAQARIPESEPVEIKQEVSTVLSPPSYEGNIPPKYPRVARRLRYEGTVILLVTIRADAQIRSIQIKQSSGYSVLDKAAVKAVWKWDFTTARIGDTPVEAQVEVPIRFTFDD